MVDTTLEPVQEQILELLVNHREGLTLVEICEIGNLQIPVDELSTILLELTSLGFLHSIESGAQRKWFIMYEGLTAIRSDCPWP